MKQLSFSERRRRRDGKARKKPGRKPGARASIPHETRPEHHEWNPLHITMRAIAGLPSFRQQLLVIAFERAIRDTRREGFRIVEHSIQVDHLHLAVEADSEEALARGMSSFAVRANRLFNVASGRGRGKVWRDRYHRRDLTTPRQVRNALVYALNNARKHGTISLEGLVIDPGSSAPCRRLGAIYLGLALAFLLGRGAGPSELRTGPCVGIGGTSAMLACLGVFELLAGRAQNRILVSVVVEGLVCGLRVGRAVEPSAVNARKTYRKSR